MHEQLVREGAAEHCKDAEDEKVERALGKVNIRFDADQEVVDECVDECEMDQGPDHALGAFD